MDGNDDNHGKKKRSREEYMSNYGNNKKPNYDKSHHDSYHKENKSDKDRECVICKMNNHWESSLINLIALSKRCRFGEQGNTF